MKDERAVLTTSGYLRYAIYVDGKPNGSYVFKYQAIAARDSLKRVDRQKAQIIDLMK